MQSPTFKFIQQITQKNNSLHSFNDLYLFLTPQDSSTFEFIELMNNLEIKCQEIIDQHKNNMSVISIIKSCDIDDDNQENDPTKYQIKQVVKYLKIKLLDMTQIEYKNEYITIDQLNNLVEFVNLKLIFEISMAWITKNKVGIYLKPIKIKAVDIPKVADVEFREDSEISDISHMEQTENIKQIINSQSLMSLGDSAFKTKRDFVDLKINNNQTNNQVNSETIQNLNAFIPSNGYNNIQDQLKNELHELNGIRHNSNKNKQVGETSNKNKLSKNTKSVSNNKINNDKANDKSSFMSQQLYSNYTVTQNNNSSNNNSSSISSEEISSDNESSSIEIQNYGRKKKKINKVQQVKQVEDQLKNKGKRGRPKKEQFKQSINEKKSIISATSSSMSTKSTKSTNEKTDSIIKLKELIDDDDTNIEHYIHTESESLNFDLEYDN